MYSQIEIVFIIFFEKGIYKDIIRMVNAYLESPFYVSWEGLSLLASNQQKKDYFYKWVFLKKKDIAENKFISVNYSFNAIWIAILNTQHVPVYWLPEGAVCLCMHMCICVCNIKSEYQKKTTLHRVSHGVEGIEGCPPILWFFSRNPHPPKLMPPPIGCSPHLKMKPPHLKTTPLPPTIETWNTLPWNDS